MSARKKTRAPLQVSPQPTLKLGKSERTRAAILNAAFDFIWSHPFRDMSVGSLMAATGVSRATFYQYFEGRHELMETLLDMLQDDILGAASPWTEGTGDPVALLRESVAGLVRVVYQRGPLLRAVTDAAAADERFEAVWQRFLTRFDEATCVRIEADQKQDLIPAFDARPVAVALTRLDAYTLLEAFGQRPRSRPEPVQQALTRIWISTLYGTDWLAHESTSLVRK